MSKIILVLVGIGMLIGGIFTMRFGLKQMFSNKIQKLIVKLTVSPWRGLLVGSIASAIMQGSTAVSLITIGLASAEYLSFYESLGIILGANIGTCTTVQLMTLSISDNHYWFLLCGCIALMLLKKFRYFAISIAGLMAMFLGLSLISKALNDVSQIIQYIVIAKYNPLYGILGGIAMTTLFQSSSAATGILMVLAEEGLLDITTAAYIVYGNNIGSCISSVIVGVTAPLAAKRVAASHVVLNILGVLLFFPFTHLLTAAASWFASDFSGQIAVTHTIFNVISSLVIMPVIKPYANFIMFLIPGKNHRK